MSNDLKKQLIKLGSTNPELRPHIKPLLASLGSVKMSKDTFTENYLKEDIQDALEKANLWRGYQWKQESSFQYDHTDPTTTVTFSTRMNGQEFSFSLDSHSQVHIYQGKRFQSFNGLDMALRWLQKEFSKTSNLQSWSQSGGSPKTPEDRKSAAFIQKMLDKVGLWRGRRWEYFTSSQEGVDPSGRVGYSTFSDGRGDEELWIHGIKQGYFSIGIQVYGNEAGEVSITHGDGNKYDSFPNLNAAQRWLAR